MDSLLLNKYAQLTDEALRCAQRCDLCGMSACLRSRRKILEKLRGFANNTGDLYRGIIRDTLRKDLQIKKLIEDYRGQLENEIDRCQQLHAQHIQYSGCVIEKANFLNRSA